MDPQPELTDAAAGAPPPSTNTELKEVTAQQQSSMGEGDPDSKHYERQIDAAKATLASEGSQDENVNLAVKSNPNQPLSENQLQVADTKPAQIVEREEQGMIGSNGVNNQNAAGRQVQPSSQENSASSGSNSTPTIPFHMLIPILRSHLDKDKDMQLQAVWTKLRSNQVSREHFLRVIKSIVGDQMLKQAARKVVTQIQANTQRNTPGDLNQDPPGFNSTPTVSGPMGYPGQGSNIQPNLPNSSASKGVHSLSNRPSTVNTTIPLQMQTQQSVVQTSQDMHGASVPEMQGFRPVGAPQTLQPPTIDLQTGLTPHAQGTIHPQPRAAAAHLGWQQGSVAPRPNTFPSMPHATQQRPSQLAGPAPAPPRAVTPSMPLSRAGATQGPRGTPGTPSTQSPSVATVPLASVNMSTPQKKGSVGHKKPLEASSSGSQSASKKQKTAGSYHDQSLEQLNDVTAVSGVDLKEEEEQLLSAPKEESRVSETFRRVVQQEEERLIIQSNALHKKLVQIMSRNNLKIIGGDVERCISMCLEERLRGLVQNIMRLSKQRLDVEKNGHRIVVTYDVHNQIVAINRKAKEEWDKKHVEEAEKLRKQNEIEGNMDVDAEKDKDGRLKGVKVNREEDDKYRTNAANVAARAAIGGDDMLSKWQLMAEMAKKKSEGLGASPGPQHGNSPLNKSAPKPVAGSSKVPQEAGIKSNRVPAAAPGSGGMRRPGRSPLATSRLKSSSRGVSIKDVISVLEREPQMAKSPLLYRLYERPSYPSPVE